MSSHFQREFQSAGPLHDALTHGGNQIAGASLVLIRFGDAEGIRRGEQLQPIDVPVANGNAFEVTDAEGFSTHTTYDLCRNVTTFVDELGRATTYHDDHGLLERQVNPDRTRTIREI